MFLAFLVSIASAQGVRVVTPVGGLDFAEIQPAVDVAVDGDVLLVGEGSYSCFTVDGKSLSIVAVPGAEVQVGGYVCVQNLAANQTVLLSGIKVLGTLGGCIEVELLKLESNQGFVRVQDCAFIGEPGYFAAVCFGANDGRYGASVVDCDRVAFLDTDLTGGEGLWHDSYNGSCDAGAGGSALRAVRSNIALYECGVTGGRGGRAKYHAGAGGAGVEAIDSEVFIAGDWIQGGAGGHNYGLYTWAAGGASLSLDASSVLRALDSAVSGGFGQPPGEVLTGPGSYYQLPSLARSVQAPTVVASGGLLTVAFEGAADDEVSMSLSSGPGQVYLASLSGVQLTAFPATWQGPFGVASPQGSLSFPLPFPQLAPGSPHGSLVLQGLAEISGNQFLSSARHALVLSPTVGPDCNGNGHSDYLDVIMGVSPDQNNNLIPDACEAATSYCTAGTSASGCSALILATGIASAAATSGFTLSAAGVEGGKDGLFFFGTNGQQANAWGTGTSFQCVGPPVKRLGLQSSTGTSGLCDGAFGQDLNAVWCPSCPKPAKNPGAGAVVQAQLWYRDPFSTSNQTTSLSDAIEFTVAP